MDQAYGRSVPPLVPDVQWPTGPHLGDRYLLSLPLPDLTPGSIDR